MIALRAACRSSSLLCRNGKKLYANPRLVKSSMTFISKGCFEYINEQSRELSFMRIYSLSKNQNLLDTKLSGEMWMDWEDGHSMVSTLITCNQDMYRSLIYTISLVTSQDLHFPNGTDHGKSLSNNAFFTKGLNLMTNFHCKGCIKRASQSH